MSSPEPAPSLVLYSLAARRKLRQRTTRAAATNPDALAEAMNEIDRALQHVFPDGGAAVVQDVYASYRPRPGEYILLVELTNSGEADGVSVVKLGPADRLRKELDGWEACRPHGLRHDLVLTGLEPRYHDDTKELIALVYADAEQFLGVDQTLSLEAALLDSVRLGVPTPESVGDVLFYLYERLGLILYRCAYADDPLTPAVPFAPERLDGRLRDNLAACEARTGPVFTTRAVANSASYDAGVGDRFVDPCRFLQCAVAQPATHVPRLLRGHGHGDLHGRNVLVGRVGDRVLWPTVFDYGDMGRDNLIGWDFVKMETEFKLRAYPDVFAGPQQDFVADVVRFEHALHARTEECRDANRWPTGPAAATPADRLHWLVLMIRRYAGQHLSHLNRSREWLAEYYFLLAVYGLNGVRFENLTDRQRLGGYLSAGCAASRYQYDRTPTPTFRDVLLQATAWRRENTPDALDRARKVLTDAVEQYPEALPLGDELVLVLKQQRDYDEAIAQLRGLERRFKHVTEETLCRWGSLFKSRANQRLAAGGLSEGLRDLADSERYYGRAYQEHHTFYPRINELTVRFVRAGLTRAADLLADVEAKAAEMLADATVWQPRKADDLVWSAASRGEACVLLRRWADAEKAYGDAMHLAAGRRFYYDCMRDQLVGVIFPAFERLGLTVEGKLTDPAAFFAVPAA